MQTLRSGEPQVLPLERHHSAERSIRAAAQVHCCRCGLGHIHDYEVFKGKKSWVLVVRSYRIE